MIESFNSHCYSFKLLLLVGGKGTYKPSYTLLNKIPKNKWFGKWQSCLQSIFQLQHVRPGLDRLWSNKTRHGSSKENQCENMGNVVKEWKLMQYVVNCNKHTMITAIISLPRTKTCATNAKFQFNMSRSVWLYLIFDLIIGLCVALQLLIWDGSLPPQSHPPLTWRFCHGWLSSGFKRTPRKKNQPNIIYIYLSGV